MTINQNFIQATGIKNCDLLHVFRDLFLKAYLYKFIPFVRFHTRQKLIQPIRMEGTAVLTRGSIAIQRQRKYL